jgi:CelD/BcsL family acetyltransferase involved in cellulose biosynthesis
VSDRRVQLVDAHSIVTEWEELAKRVGTSPCAHPGWYLAWCKAYGHRRFVALAAYQSERLVGVLPLQTRRGVLSSPTNWHTPEYVIPSEGEEVEQDLLEGAVELNKRRLQLAFVEKPLVNGLEALAAETGKRCMSRVLERGPFIALQGDFSRYEASLGAHLRAELRRRRRRLSEMGPISLTVHTRADEHLLETFFRVEAAGWKGQQGTAIAAQPAARRFYIAIARWAATNGWLRLALLKVGDRVVAGDLALQYRSTHYLLKTGFDPEFRRFAPGKLLRHGMLKTAFADDLEFYEFLGIDDEWKKEWTPTVRTRYMVQVFAPTVRGRLDRAAHVYARPIAKAALAQVNQWRGR